MGSTVCPELGCIYATYCALDLASFIHVWVGICVWFQMNGWINSFSSKRFLGPVHYHLVRYPELQSIVVRYALSSVVSTLHIAHLILLILYTCPFAFGFRWINNFFFKMISWPCPFSYCSISRATIHCSSVCPELGCIYATYCAPDLAYFIQCAFAFPFKWMNE